MSVSEFLYDRAKQQTQVRNIIKIKQKDDFSAISRELSDLWLKEDKKENSKKIKKKSSETDSEFDITAELSDLWLKK